MRVLARLFLTVLLMIMLTMLVSAQDDITYVIQPLDTLDQIAQEFDVSVVSLIQANGIENTRTIQPGLAIIIPADAPPYGVYPALDMPEEGAGGGANGELYVIQPNDTLDVIGQEYDVSVISLMLVNNITNTRRLMPGQTILIPDDAPAYGIYPALDMPEDGIGGGANGELYVIQPNDNLDLIGQEYDVSVISLMMVNGITDVRALMPGQTILIPDDAPAYGVYPALEVVEDPEDGSLYVVQVNDNLDGIAAAYNAELACVILANGIDDAGSIVPGQVIFIPDDCPAYVGANVPGGAGETSGDNETEEAIPSGEMRG